jgi:condensin complex subunit 2
MQINQLKAAASPMRRLNEINRASSSSPKTPRSSAARGKENGDNGFDIIDDATGGHSTTPMKRVPILANFEEWMKMATDNVSSPGSFRV